MNENDLSYMIRGAAFKDVHHKQLLTNLKLTNKKLGLLINFNVLSVKNGIIRIVNNL